MSNYIAIDIGGTQTRLAVFPLQSNTPTLTTRIPTQQEGELPLDRVLGLIASVWEQSQPVLAIGAAVASPVDPNRGIVIAPPNIPGWINLPLQKHIQDRFLFLLPENDANLAPGGMEFGSGRRQP
jgi:glucokinase